MILLLAQKKQEDEDPLPEDLYGVGTVAMIMRMLKLPDGRIRVLVQGLARALPVLLLQRASVTHAQVQAVLRHARLTPQQVHQQPFHCNSGPVGY